MLARQRLAPILRIAVQGWARTSSTTRHPQGRSPFFPLALSAPLMEPIAVRAPGAALVVPSWVSEGASAEYLAVNGMRSVNSSVL